MKKRAGKESLETDPDPGGAGAQGVRGAEMLQHRRNESGVNTLILYVLAAILFLTPLAASGAILHEYSIPKYLVLLVGASALTGLIGYAAVSGRGPELIRLRGVQAIAAFSIAAGLSCLLSANPIISLQGAFSTFMGYSTYLCFAAVFTAVILAVRTRHSFEFLLRSITVSGLIVSVVGIGQLSGLVPINAQAADSFGPTFRIYSTLGHPDFAGNYFLYIVFAGEATAFISRSSRWRTLGGATSVLAALALIFTGTRGAWLGLLAGIGIAVLIAARHGMIPVPGRKTLIRAILIAVAVGVAGVAGLIYTRLGSPVRSRLAAVASEGFTGAGRVTDWKLSLRMLSRYWPIGCGPDMYRLAQVPFKTDEYSRKTYGIDAEDAHSTYLSALVSFGVVGFVLYLVLIVLAFRGFGHAIKIFAGSGERSCSIALAAGLGGAMVHDLFLHHLVVTGLYFFTFLALGAQAACLAESEGKEAQPEDRVNEGAKTKEGSAKGRVRNSRKQSRRVWRLPKVPGAAWISAMALVFVTGFYSYALAAADHDIDESLAAASTANKQLTVSAGNRATAYPLYQTDCYFYFGGALDKLSTLASGADSEELLKMAVNELQPATTRTLLPVSSLASLALVKIRLGDFEGAKTAIEGAQQIDPHTYLTHLAWSSFYLKQKRLEESIIELKLARGVGARQVYLEQLQKNLGEALTEAHDQRLWELFNGRPGKAKKGDARGDQQKR